MIYTLKTVMLFLAGIALFILAMATSGTLSATYAIACVATLIMFGDCFVKAV